MLIASQKPGEPLIMIGINKPSVHFYTGKVVIYEKERPRNLVNLTDRLTFEKRQGWSGSSLEKNNIFQFFFRPKNVHTTALIIIDEKSSELPHWSGLNPNLLGQFGIYKVWRIERTLLERRANKLIKDGLMPNWRLPKPERF